MEAHMDVNPLTQTLFQGRSTDQESYEKTVGQEARAKDEPDSAITGVIPPALPQDTFEKTANGDSQALSNAQEKDSSGLKISMHFDLFYKLSEKVTARMGQSGGRRFAEVASSVAETFKGNFSLKIDAIGSYLNGTDKSLAISPETANSFFDAVSGLADQSPEALQSFLKESDKFFNELESKYGESGGTFDDLKKQVQQQASEFFKQVTTTRNQFAGEAAAAPDVLPAAETAQQALANPANQLIPIAFGKDDAVSSDQYQAFLKSFAEYVRKFRDQTIQDFFKMPRQAGQSISESSISQPTLSAAPLEQTPTTSIGQPSAASAFGSAVETPQNGEASAPSRIVK